MGNMISTIKIGGIEHTVREVPLIEVDGNRNVIGAIHHRTTEILILDSLSEERKQDVLIHEILHGIFYEAGYEEQDEKMIDMVAKFLNLTLKDNDFSWARNEDKELIENVE